MDKVESINSSSARLKEIVSILAKYGIADWLNGSNIEWIKKHLKTAAGKDILKFSKAERIRLALTELGTTYVKLGQILSTRSDVVGEEVATELSKLQSSTPADSIVKIRSRIKKEFGVKSVDEVFASFETKAIASASIAQVHKATLHSGENVVVKIMHDGIEEKVKEDLKILINLASIAQKHGGQLKAFQPLALIRQFSQTMLNELDFGMELNNLRKFAESFDGDTRVVFPHGYKEYSRKRVLTMSFIEGHSLQDIDGLDWSPEQKSDFTEESADVFMEMMFRDRFYHADPHPGNLLVRTDGSLGVIDCGMVSKLDSRTNEIFEDLIIGVAQKDAEHIKNTILEMCTLPKTVDFDILTLQIDEFIEKYLDLPLNEFDISAALNDGVGIIQQHHLILPPNVSNLLRVVGLLEGSSRLLNPNFNIAVLFKKYHHKILQRRYSPKNLILRLTKNVHQWEHIIDTVPKLLDKVLRKASQDDFEVNLEHRNLEKSVNRIVMGLVTAALYLGSSILWSFKVPPQISGFSIFGVAGVVISSILAFRLIREINRDKK